MKSVEEEHLPENKTLQTEPAGSSGLRPSQRIVETLDASSELDADTLVRLQAMRRQALAQLDAGVLQSEPRRAGYLFWSRFAAASLVVVLAAGTFLVLQQLGEDGASLVAAVEDQRLQQTESKIDSPGQIDISGALADVVQGGVLAGIPGDGLQDEALLDEQFSLLADDSYDIEFYESLAFLEWLETQEA